MTASKEKIKNQPQKREAAEKGRGKFWASRIGLFVFFTLLTGMILVYEHSDGLEGREFVVGEPAPKTLFAPFELAYEDAVRTKALREERRNSILPVLRLDAAALNRAGQALDKFFEAVLEWKKPVSASKPDGPPAEKAWPKAWPLSLPDQTVRYLLDEPDLEDVRKSAQLLLVQLYTEGILERKTKDALIERGTTAMTVIQDDEDTGQDVAVQGIRTLEDALRDAEGLLAPSVARNRSMKRGVLDLLEAVAETNLREDPGETQVRRAKAAASIGPVQEVIKKDELIVQRGMLVTAAERQRIDEIQRKMVKQRVLEKFMAVTLFVLMVYLLAFVYLAGFEKKTFRSRRMLVFVFTTFVLTALLSKLIAEWPGASPYLMPTALAPLLLVLLSAARLGVLGAIVMTALAGPLAGFQPDVILATLVSGVAVTHTAVGLRKRHEFLKVGFALAVSYGLVLFVFQAYQEYGVMQSLQVSSLGLANGLLITIPLCFLLLPVMEHVFDLLTDITLLELSDLNHPLLKRMIVEAPGTYHHSLVVSTLAEAACREVGANALLARVGCYFHDIGKIARAEYFTENQRDKVNRHDRMNAEDSSFVIMDHVIGGIALGRKYKLKEPILRFIPEHHGTGIIYYFYKKALDAAAPGEKVNADDFRYDGPKPQSRETAVALLADSTEAASRSMREPSEEGISQLVRKIINDKFIDGQLDECDLTLRDLHQIQHSFVQNLMAIYHTRVQYPAKPEDADRPDLFRENEFSKYRSDSPC